MATTLALAAVGVLAGCQVQITPEGARYVVTDNTGAITFTNSSSGSNEREVLWASNEPSETSSTECATWETGNGIAQNGIAFRIDADPGKTSRAVVLERNIWLNGFWDFVVVYFRNSGGMGEFDVGPGVNLGNYLGTSTAQDVFPLRVCAEISKNDTLTFAVAKGGDPMPVLGTEGQGGTLALDRAEVPERGATGTYIAHVPRGTSDVVDDVTIDGEPAARVTS